MVNNTTKKGLSLEEKAVLERYSSWNEVVGEKSSNDNASATAYSSCSSFCSGGACEASCRGAFVKYDLK